MRGTKLERYIVYGVFIALPLLVAIIFILIVQNSYLKSASGVRTEQIKSLSEELQTTQKLLEDVIKRQKENSKKLDTEVEKSSGKSSGSSSSSIGTASLPNSTSQSPNVSQNTSPRRSSGSGSTGGSSSSGGSNSGGSTPSQPSQPPASKPENDPTLLCNPLLPLIC